MAVGEGKCTDEELEGLDSSPDLAINQSRDLGEVSWVSVILAEFCFVKWGCRLLLCLCSSEVERRM